MEHVKLSLKQTTAELSWYGHAVNGVASVGKLACL